MKIVRRRRVRTWTRWRGLGSLEPPAAVASAVVAPAAFFTGTADAGRRVVRAPPYADCSPAAAVDGRALVPLPVCRVLSTMLCNMMFRSDDALRLRVCNSPCEMHLQPAVSIHPSEAA